ncbi:MAG: sigma-70 family RNA polymerase sigma factor [Flavobacteriales bacterium]|nr:sigma-70 family RNA polymerase sigma factor [Flavobacteriales bacterium]
MSNDEQLVKLCIEKNREAQKMLFEKYASRMMGICLRYTASNEDAKDILQEGFVKVFTKLDSFNFGSSLQTWMSRIFTNLAINHITRGKAKYTHVDIEETEQLAYEDSSEDMEKWGGLTSEQILEHVQQLPDKYRVVLNMYAIDGYSHQEIADQLGLTVNNSKSRLLRARAILKEKIRMK